MEKVPEAQREEAHHRARVREAHVRGAIGNGAAAHEEHGVAEDESREAAVLGALRVDGEHPQREAQLHGCRDSDPHRPPVPIEQRARTEFAG